MASTKELKNAEGTVPNLRYAEIRDERIEVDYIFRIK
jgi:hypothetical protein